MIEPIADCLPKAIGIKEISGLGTHDADKIAYGAAKAVDQRYPRSLQKALHLYFGDTLAYARPEGNRFNDARRGAWYCTFEDLTAIHEVAFHRTRELARIGLFEDEAVYQGLLPASRMCPLPSDPIIAPIS